MDKSDFEAKFRARIKPDTSDWKNHPAAQRSRRGEFKRSQQVASRILGFLENNPNWSRQRLAEELGVSLQRISTILKGKANFTLNSIETLERALNINLLGEERTYYGKLDRQKKTPGYGESIALVSHKKSISGTYIRANQRWTRLGDPSFEALRDEDGYDPIAA